MLKFVQCIRRQPDIELYEFRQYWSEYSRRLERFCGEFGIGRLDFSTALAIEQDLDFMVAASIHQIFDAMVEIHFDDAAFLHRLASDPDFKAGIGHIKELQEEFIDFERSTFFFAIDDDGR